VWDVASGKEVRRLEMQERNTPLRFGAYRLALSNGGRLLAVSNHFISPTARGLVGKIYLWDVDSGKEVRCISLGDSGFGGLALSADGGLLAAACNGGLTLWRPSDGKKLWQRERVSGGDTCLAFAPDGRSLAIATTFQQGREIALWECITEKLRCRFAGHGAIVTCLAFSHDGSLLATGGEDATILLWDLTGRRQ
jgi:WD40 repeat protein